MAATFTLALGASFQGMAPPLPSLPHPHEKESRSFILPTSQDIRRLGTHCVGTFLPLVQRSGKLDWVLLSGQGVDPPALVPVPQPQSRE